MSITLNKILAAREGGSVERCHGIKHLTPYNNAMHTYNAVCMLYLLMAQEDRQPSHNLVQALLYHDVAERWVGDIPAPLKMLLPDVKKRLNELEQKFLDVLGLGEPFHALTEEEENWLHAVDKLELFVWAKEEEAMGNGYAARPVASVLLDWFENNKLNLPAICVDLYHELISGFRRMPEFGYYLRKIENAKDA